MFSQSLNSTLYIWVKANQRHPLAVQAVRPMGWTWSFVCGSESNYKNNCGTLTDWDHRLSSETEVRWESAAYSLSTKVRTHPHLEVQGHVFLKSPQSTCKEWLPTIWLLQTTRDSHIFGILSYCVRRQLIPLPSPILLKPASLICPKHILKMCRTECSYSP